MASTNGTAGTSPLADSPASSLSPASSPSPSSSPQNSASRSPSQPSSVPTSPSVAPSTGSPSASPSPTPSPSQPSSRPVTESSPATSEPPSSTPVTVPTSEPVTSNPPSSASSSAPASSVRPTSTITARPSSTSTQIVTSIITPTPTSSGESVEPITVISTIIRTDSAATSSAATSSATSSTNPALVNPQNKGTSDGGLSPGGRTAIAVVIPVVVVALLLLGGIFFWRKRKQRKNAEEARRKEVEEYGYNPNEDPTLPAVGMATEMAEDQSGYRGWGNTTTSSNRKASTTLTSGMTYSDSNSNPGEAYGAPGSPTHAYSDGHSGDPLMNGRRETMESDVIGALGAAPSANQNQTGVHRGPSNASSSYSGADRSENSDNYPLPMNNQQDFYGDNSYYQNGSYNDGYGASQQPIIRDVSARRNTRIENPSVFPQQGNSGIAQNF